MTPPQKTEPEKKSGRIVEGFILVALLAVTGYFAFTLNPSSKEEVIVYTSQDQVYAEPIFREFEKETGIKVRPVYDSEAVKTVGLANRLLAESEVLYFAYGERQNS